MTTRTMSPAAGSALTAVALSSLGGPIIVATDGSEESAGALTAAAIISRRTGAPVEVVSAVEPMSAPLVPPELVLPMTQMQEEEERRRVALIEEQVRTYAGHDDWPMHIVRGQAASAISGLSHERRAALVVVSFGQHGLLARMFGTETPLRIAHVTDAPILCVPPGFARLPRLVVLAVDFGIECLRAAAAVRPLLTDVTHVYLVHVKPKGRLDVPERLQSEWERAYESSLGDVFARVIETLALSPDVGVTTAILRGQPAHELLRFSAAASADLLVAGHGHRRRVERLLAGSVASQLYRGAQCALLLAPNVAPASSLPRAGMGTTTEIVDRRDWPAELQHFGARNATRPTRMEIDDDVLGSTVAAHGLPLMSADYDWRDDAVELTIGDEKAGQGHLAHVVRAPVQLSVLRGPDGRDLALRIATAKGQTLVRFET